MDYDLTLIGIIVGIFAGIVASGVGILKLYYMREDRKPKFTYERIKENNVWKLMILHPDKPIHKISVFCDKTPLPLSNTNREQYERTMRVGEGQNFDAGEKIDDDSIILIKYDKYKVEEKWKDIPLYHYGNF